METTGAYATEMVFRWLHVVFGIMWIGLLYFFNFVNAHFAKTLDADTKKKVVPELMPRALFFFRGAAMATFLLGLGLLYFVYMAPGHARNMVDESGAINPIMWGVTFGTIMWFNVWFIIWPSQRKIINGIKGGNPAAPEVVARAALFSKINTYLSLPMTFFMVAGPHFPSMSWLWVGVVTAVGFAIVWHLYKISAKVSTEV